MSAPTFRKEDTRNFRNTLAGGIALGLFFSATTQAEATEATLDSISIPDKVETNFCTLEFFDGVPSDVTIDKLYDNLDRMRAVGVYLDNMGGVSPMRPTRSLCSSS